MALPLIIAFIAKQGILKAIKKYGPTAVKKAVKQSQQIAKQPKAMEPAKRLQQRQAQAVANKAGNAKGTTAAAITGASTGEALKDKKKSPKPSMTDAQRKAGSKLPKKAGVGRNPFDTKKAAGTTKQVTDKDLSSVRRKTAEAKLAREANNTPTPVEIKRAKARQTKPSMTDAQRKSGGTTGAKKYNVGVSKGGVPFKEAFAYYRKQGNKTFTWNGKKYTTETAAEKKKATKAPAKKAAPKKRATMTDSQRRAGGSAGPKKKKGGVLRDSKGGVVRDRYGKPVRTK